MCPTMDRKGKGLSGEAVCAGGGSFSLNVDVLVGYPNREGGLLYLKSVTPPQSLNIRMERVPCEESVKDLAYLTEGQVFNEKDREMLICMYKRDAVHGHLS